MKFVWGALLLSSAALAAQEPLSFDQALAAAKARHQPVFVDFHAPWCHSCFFMEKNVMNGADWDTVKLHAVIADVDADAGEGAAIAQQFKVAGYPTYIVLDESGVELGRILGDRTRMQFYAELQPLLDRGATLERWQARVIDDGSDSLAAARIVFNAYEQRMDAEHGLLWLASLPAPLQKAVAVDAVAGARINELKLLRANQQHDAAQCEAVAPAVIGGALDCDNVGFVSELRECIDPLPAEQKRAQLAPIVPRMAALQKQILVEHKGACSDTRGVVDPAADLYDALDDKTAYRQVFEQGIAYSERGLKAGKGIDYRRDHYLADNLRYYLERLEDNARLDHVYPKLIAAYPEPYDYYYRYGKNLAKRGEYARALPLLEQAAPRSYGRNRLWVAQWRAYTLLQLKRNDDANVVASEAMQANGPWFPDDIARLKGVLAGDKPK
ncbi:MAG TPA: thioredoxin family protein [Nevskiaceae bacterium]|nr:thioredoxin family protein [Nevskiaceae bacterium]